MFSSSSGCWSDCWFSSSSSSGCWFLRLFMRDAIESSTSSMKKLLFFVSFALTLSVFLLSFLFVFFSVFVSFFFFLFLLFSLLPLLFVAILSMSMLSSGPCAVLFDCWVGEPDVDVQSLATWFVSFVAFMSIDYNIYT